MIPAFTNELKYIRNVSSKTLELYTWSFKAFEGAIENRTTMVARIGELRDKGAKPVTVNTYLRCLNSYFNWLHKEHGHQRLKLPKLKEEQTVIASFSPEQVARIINWKPVKGAETRLYTLTLTALDSGLRINEMLCLRRTDVDLDNLLLRVVGKGNKERLVPMSVELRKVLYRYLAKHEFDRVFCTHEGVQLGQRNVLRDFKVFCKKLRIAGVRCSFHTLRHTFAVSYLRAGGNVLYLQRILGHTTLHMTNRYVQSLGIEDLKAVHSGLSLLSR